MFSVLVLTVLLYGSEVWCLREDPLAKLRSFHNRCCRAMCRITMVHTRRCRIPSVQLYRRLGIAAVEQYYRRRLPRLAGNVSRMPMDRLPRQLLTGFVANPRPTGSPLVTWGRTLKKALIKCGQSPSFDVWRQAAADRMSWRQNYGQFAPLPRPKPTSYADQVHEIIYGPPPRLGTPAAQPTTPAPSQPPALPPATPPTSCVPSAASGPSPGRPTGPVPRRAWTPSLRNALRPLLHDDESQQ